MLNYPDSPQETSNPKILCDFMLLKALFPNYSQKISDRKSPTAIKKLSKAEAFFDLVNRQRLTRITTGDNVINISIMSLSDSWGWNRKTTRSFLDELVKLDVLDLKFDTNKTLIQLTNFIGQ